MKTKSSNQALVLEKSSRRKAIAKDFEKNKYKYLMLVPVLIYFFVFHYMPMYGVIIAFKNYRPALGILGSDWVGFAHFQSFFTDVYFWRLIRNTLILSFYSITIGFPMPIILALLLNELKSTRFKKIVQTVVYIPHFITIVVVCGLLTQYCSSSGLFNDIRAIFGFDRIPLLQEVSWFRPLYIGSDIWQSVGWSSIIYIAALSGVDPTLYEAADIDGANRWHKVWNISIPCILPTIMMLLILRMGNILNIGYEKIMLMYNPVTYEVADVISTYVYRKALIDGSFSFGSAVGLFNSVVNLIFIVTANKLSKRTTGVHLY